MTDDDIAHAIQALAEARGPGKTFCPSEVARRLSDDWRPLMDDIRRIAAAMDTIEATQGGIPVDPGAARGPIRLRALR
ncbi:DUF3253 domain-containing protein [Aestuariibius sp. 2305UL40-4]|uniref:DUF3253 domain-containing protein n=1 Tax=Aestuariibius violaceus TaxID=3234132 RepID=UPI00345E20C9